ENAGNKSAGSGRSGVIERRPAAAYSVPSAPSRAARTSLPMRRISRSGWLSCTLRSRSTYENSSTVRRSEPRTDSSCCFSTAQESDSRSNVSLVTQFFSAACYVVEGCHATLCCADLGEWIVLECPMIARRRFQLVLIKPSHYDDDGYVIRWWRAMIPSNSLAAVYGIAADCAERQVLGPDVVIDIEVIDETNTRIDVPGLLARFRSHSNFGLVALTGVQSNQYPRALDIARPFRDAGIQVAMGGFHVSGCLSMLD